MIALHCVVSHCGILIGPSCITQAVLWTLWSRLVRLHSYLRQLLAETPAQKLHICSAVKRQDWGVVVACMDTEVGGVRLF